MAEIRVDVFSFFFLGEGGKFAREHIFLFFEIGPRMRALLQFVHVCREAEVLASVMSDEFLGDTNIGAFALP